MDGDDMDRLVEEENRRMRRLRFIVDLARSVLMQSDLSIQEAYRIMEDAKKAALILFPDKEDVYDLIYAPRFKRIISGKFTMHGSYFGKN